VALDVIVIINNEKVLAGLILVFALVAFEILNLESFEWTFYASIWIDVKGKVLES